MIFWKINFNIYVCLCAWAGRADGIRLPGSSIVDREPPNMGSGKQTQVLQKYMLSATEPPLQPLSRYFYHSRTRVTRASIQTDPPPFPYSNMKHYCSLCSQNLMVNLQQFAFRHWTQHHRHVYEGQRSEWNAARTRKVREQGAHWQSPQPSLVPQCRTLQQMLGKGYKLP